MKRLFGKDSTPSLTERFGIHFLDRIQTLSPMACCLFRPGESARPTSRERKARNSVGGRGISLKLPAWRQARKVVSPMPWSIMNRTLLAATALVAAASALLPVVGGYGTVLYQNVTLYGWHLAEIMTSNRFAYDHRAFSWSVAAVLSVLSFLLPAVAVLLVCKRRWQTIGAAVVATWCCVYIACLFLVFPATNGP